MRKRKKGTFMQKKSVKLCSLVMTAVLTIGYLPTTVDNTPLSIPQEYIEAYADILEEMEVDAGGAGESAAIGELILPTFTNSREDDFITSSGMLLVDMTESSVIASSNANKQYAATSINQLLTYFVLLKELDLNTLITFDSEFSEQIKKDSVLSQIGAGGTANTGDIMRYYINTGSPTARKLLVRQAAKNEKEFLTLVSKMTESSLLSSKDLVDGIGGYISSKKSSAYDLYYLMHQLMSDTWFRDNIGSVSETIHGTKENGTEKDISYQTNKIPDMEIPDGYRIVSRMVSGSGSGNSSIILLEGTDGHFYLSVILSAKSGIKKVTEKFLKVLDGEIYSEELPKASVQVSGPVKKLQVNKESDQDNKLDKEADKNKEANTDEETSKNTETDKDKEVNTDKETSKNTEADKNKEANTDKETSKNTETDKDKEVNTDKETSKNTETDKDKETNTDKETSKNTETDKDKEVNTDKETSKDKESSKDKETNKDKEANQKPDSTKQQESTTGTEEEKPTKNPEELKGQDSKEEDKELEDLEDEEDEEITVTPTPTVNPEQKKPTKTPSVSYSPILPTQSNDARYEYIFGTKAQTYTTRNLPSSFNTEAKARSQMKTITVPVWKMTASGGRYKSSMSLTIHKKVAANVQAIFDEIFALDLKFPIKVLKGYGYRKVGGVGLSNSTLMSMHAFGVAIDINPGDYDNDYFLGEGNDLRDKSNPYCIPDEVIEIFEKHGWYWGGNFSICADTMHFQYLGLEFLTYQGNSPFRELAVEPSYMKGADVKNLQSRLSRLGFSIRVDGVYAKETESVIKKAQLKYGLPVTGVVDYKTWETIINLTHYMPYVF